MPEIAPDTIRNATLTRRLRGYDREETDELLAKIAKTYASVYAERDRLAEEVVAITAERQEREAGLRRELESLREQLRERDRRITDLEAHIARFEGEHSQNLKDLDRLRSSLECLARRSGQLRLDGHVCLGRTRRELRARRRAPNDTVTRKQIPRSAAWRALLHALRPGLLGMTRFGPQQLLKLTV